MQNLCNFKKVSIKKVLLNGQAKKRPSKDKAKQRKGQEKKAKQRKGQAKKRSRKKAKQRKGHVIRVLVLYLRESLKGQAKKR